MVNKVNYTKQWSLIMLETFLKLISIEIFQIYWILQWVTNFNEKHVSMRGCKHCYCLTFQPGIAYATRQSEAKGTSFDLPLHRSSSSKHANVSSLDTVMW
jgi:hypothetical protein